MQSQITFLGTAGDAFVLSKQQRLAGGIVIQVQNMQIHCNPGPGALVAAMQQKIDIRNTSMIILTDDQFIHTHDADAILGVMTLGGFDAKGLLFIPESMKDKLQFQSTVEKTIILSEDARIACNDVQIQAIKIKSKDKHAVGLRIIAPTFSLGYTGKTKYFARLSEAMKDVEILILELSGDVKEGLSVADAEVLIAAVKPQLAVLTNFGVDVLKNDILEMTRNMYQRTGVQIIAAKEGFSFDPTSYAVQLRQQRLTF